MMTTKKLIEFKKEREIGEMLADSFTFLRRNLSGLWNAFVRNSLVWFIIFLVGSGFYMYNVGDLFENLAFIDNPENVAKVFKTFGKTFIYSTIFMVLSLLFFASFSTVIFSYIKNYISTEGNIDQSEIKNTYNKHFTTVVLASFIWGILGFVGFILCILPGIYIATVLSLISAIIVFEDKSLGDAFNYCFSLIKENWWMTFLALVVFYIIISVVKSIFQLPAMIYSMLEIFSQSFSAPGTELAMMTDWVYISLSMFATLCGELMNVFIIIAIGLIYFNLNEKKNLTGTLEELDRLS